MNDLAAIGNALLGMVGDQGQQIQAFGIYTILPCNACSVKVILSPHYRGQCDYCSSQSRKRKERIERGKTGLLVQEYIWLLENEMAGDNLSQAPSSCSIYTPLHVVLSVDSTPSLYMPMLYLKHQILHPRRVLGWQDRLVARSAAL